MGTATWTFPLLSSRAPLRSELLPHVLLCHRKHFPFWRPPTWGTPSAFSLSESGLTVDISSQGHQYSRLHLKCQWLVFLRTSVGFKDVAWPEVTSACNFKQQQTFSYLSVHRLVYENQESKVTMTFPSCLLKCQFQLLFFSFAENFHNRKSSGKNMALSQICIHTTFCFPGIFTGVYSRSLLLFLLQAFIHAGHVYRLMCNLLTKRARPVRFLFLQVVRSFLWSGPCPVPLCPLTPEHAA